VTVQQIASLEKEIRFSVQKIDRWRVADRDLQEHYQNASNYTPSAIRRAEGEVKYAEDVLVAALDILRDEINPLIKAATATAAT
jgi:predicted RNA-binding protein with PUA domain